MKMKKWSSQWTQFMQLRKEAWKKFRTSTAKKWNENEEMIVAVNAIYAIV